MEYCINCVVSSVFHLKPHYVALCLIGDANFEQMVKVLSNVLLPPHNNLWRDALRSCKYSALNKLLHLERTSFHDLWLKQSTLMGEMVIFNSVFPNASIGWHIVGERFLFFTFIISTDSLGKEYSKVVYCHPVYLTYMQSISWEMPGWMTYKL